jgi:hypothetical protein
VFILGEISTTDQDHFRGCGGIPLSSLSLAFFVQISLSPNMEFDIFFPIKGSLSKSLNDNFYRFSAIFCLKRPLT